jgi:hypothetical protein
MPLPPPECWNYRRVPPCLVPKDFSNGCAGASLLFSWKMILKRKEKEEEEEERKRRGRGEERDERK